MSTPRGAGRSGGLLFLAILAFVAYLALTRLPGAAGVVVAGLLAAGIVVIAANVARRR